MRWYIWQNNIRTQESKAKSQSSNGQSNNDSESVDSEIEESKQHSSSKFIEENSKSGKHISALAKNGTNRIVIRNSDIESQIDDKSANNQHNAQELDGEFIGIGDFPLHRKPTFERPILEHKPDLNRQGTYLVNDMKKGMEYEDFINNPEHAVVEEQKVNEDLDDLVEQEMFNYKVERIIGLEKDKLIFDEKYKESLCNYINNNSYKDKKNTGSVIGMTVFGVLGFVIFSGTLYLSVLGGLLGIGIGRLIGTRFKSKLKHQNLDQRVMFEMELILKWARVKRKKKFLDDLCFVLLIETVIMEVTYLLNKLELKKVRKFFKKIRKFLMFKDTSDKIWEFLPNKRDLQSDENLLKKELYRLFNFYIPLLRIFETDISKEKKFRELEIYKKIYKYITSNELIECIIELCITNETQSSQWEITFDKSKIKDIIGNYIVSEKKSDAFMKLENRVIEEIISNANIEEIKIEDGFDRLEDKGNSCTYAKPKPTIVNAERIPEWDLVREGIHLDTHHRQMDNHASYSLGDNKSLDVPSDDIEMQSKSMEHSGSNINAGSDDDREVPEDFLDLQMAVEEDTSKWGRVWETNDLLVFKKKTDGTPMVMIKAIAMLKDIPADIVYTAIFDTDIRQSWDKLFHKFEVVEHDDQHTVLYYVIKAPLGISNRDFLQLRRVEHDWPRKGVTYMHYKSIEHEEKPEYKGIVRAETIMSGYVIEQIQDDPPITKLIVVSQNDIKGLIPKYLVNMASGKAPKQWIANLVNGWEELMKKQAK